MLFALAQPPWIVRIAAEARTAYALSQALERSGIVARVVRGSKMETYQGLYNEVAAALQFPDYFGENWAALDECLADLEWLPGNAYAILVTDADRLLAAEEPEAAAAFVALVRDVAESWSRSRGSQSYARIVPFHVVLQVGEANALSPALSQAVEIDIDALVS